MKWLVFSYKYLFYRIFCFSSRINKGFLDKINKDYSVNIIAHNSYLILTLCLTMYFDSFMRFVEKVTPFDYQKYQLFLFLGSVYVFNSLLFNRVIRYKDIIENLSNEGAKSYYISTFLTLLFIGFAVWPIFALLF